MKINDSCNIRAFPNALLRVEEGRGRTSTAVVKTRSQETVAMRKILSSSVAMLFAVPLLSPKAMSDDGDCTWIAFDGSPPFTPPDVEILDDSPSETILRLTA
jgi:hypothetical protein